MLAGFGFLTRETTLLLVPLYGLMALWRYGLIAAGFAAVVGVQMGWFAWAADALDSEGALAAPPDILRKIEPPGRALMVYRTPPP